MTIQSKIQRQCPVCSEYTSAEYIACRSCGNPLVEKEKVRFSLIELLLGVLIAVLVAAVILVIINLCKPVQENAPPPPAPQFEPSEPSEVIMAQFEEPRSRRAGLVSFLSDYLKLTCGRFFTFYGLSGKIRQASSAF